MTEAELDKAVREVGEATLTALRYAAERIEAFHRAAMPRTWSMTDACGSRLGQEVRPLERVGIYVPGGRAAYPSTVLMTAVPARVAGVRGDRAGLAARRRTASLNAGRAGRRARRRA